MRTALAVASISRRRAFGSSRRTWARLGLKMQVFPETSPWPPRAQARTSVKWIEERRENFAAASQAREQRTTVEVAAAATAHCSP